MNSPKSPPQDHFLWPTILLPSLVYMLLNAVMTSQGYGEDDALFPAIGLFLLWLPIIGIRLLLALWHLLPKKCLSFVLSVLCLWPTCYGWHQLAIEDYIHLAVNYSQYQNEIHNSPTVKHEFDWGGFGFATTVNGDKTLVYDPTDTLPQTNQMIEAKWKRLSNIKNGKGEPDSERLYTRHLFKHFYVVDDVHQ